MKTIVFAGGCFWGVEAYFQQIEGVKDTRAGYIAGDTENPTYRDVCSGTGHAEAVEITYDESEVTLTILLRHYFNIVDPTLINRQGPDIGVQYRSGIYNYDNSDARRIDEFIESIRDDYDRPLFIELSTDEPFYEAEEEHQDYLKKNPGGYCHVNLSSVSKVKE